MIDESLFGYLLRICTLNSYSNISWLFELAGISAIKGTQIVSSVLFSEADLTQLADITKSDVEKLKVKTHPALGPNYFNFFGHPVNRMAIHSLYPKVCPSCIADKGYHNLFWDFALTTCCPVHNCLLINRCPACHKRLSWLRSDISFCKCGFDLRNTQSEAVPLEEIWFSKLIFNKLVSENYKISLSNGPIDHLSLGDLFTLIAIFNRNFEKGGHVNDNIFYKIKNFNIAEAHMRIINIIDLFRNWPINFYEFLNKTNFKPTSNSGLHGIVRKFGIFYDLIISDELSMFPFIEDEFNRYITNNFSDGLILRRRYRNFVSNPPKHISRAESASLLGLTEKHIDWLLNKGYISGIKVKVKSRSLIQIDKSSVDKYKNEIQANSFANSKDSPMSLREICDYLSIGFLKVVALKKAGYISPNKLEERDCFQNRKTYSKKMVDDLLKKIDDKIQFPVTPCRQIESLNFSETFHRLKFLGYKIGNMIAAILQGDLKPIGKTKKIGFDAYMFSKAEVADYQQRQLTNKSGTNIPLKEYAKSLHVTVDELRFLAGRGILKSHNSGIWHIGEVLTPEAISDFESKYIFLSRIAESHKSNSFFLLKFLDKFGIMPISGPKVDNGLNYLFLRKDLDGVDFARAPRKCRSRKKKHVK